jgi:hypothetical protein
MLSSLQDTFENKLLKWQKIVGNQSYSHKIQAHKSQQLKDTARLLT